MNIKFLVCVGIDVYLDAILLNMLELISILRRWQWKILFPVLLCTIIAIIGSIPRFMPPRYESNAVFYIANPSASDRSAIFNSENGYTNYFGGSDDIDRILSLLGSPMFADYMIKKFSLQKHYEAEDLYYTRLGWGNNFTIRKNELAAIDVTISDTDAHLAKAMADATLQYADSTYKSWILDSRKRVLAAIEEEIASMPADADMGVVAKLQLTRAQFRATNSPLFSTLYITEYPQVALKKSSPIRWMIVLAVLVGSLFFFSLAAVVLEKFRSIRS